MIAERDVDHLMNIGNYTFVVDIPPHFERDVAGSDAALRSSSPSMRPRWCRPASAPAMRSRSSRPRSAISSPAPRRRAAAAGQSCGPHRLQPQCHDRLVHQRHGHHQQLTMLAIILAGAAVVREREHGTMDHLLVMPITPVRDRHVEDLGEQPGHHRGGRPVALYRGAAIARRPDRGIGAALHGRRGRSICSSPRRSASSWRPSRAPCRSSGCSIMLVAVPLNMLSGSNTPLESMPPFLRTLMQASPSTHFVSFAQADPLSRRGLRRGVAAIRSRGRHRHAVSGPGIAAFPHVGDAGLIALQAAPPAFRSRPRAARPASDTTAMFRSVDPTASRRKDPAAGSSECRARAARCVDAVSLPTTRLHCAIRP